jgi:hydroxyacyl-ACP dehydratase HTD2-like protein with hotdog domain
MVQCRKFSKHCQRKTVITPNGSLPRSWDVSNYSYKDRYLLTASARYDGSSRLAPGNKWVLFPSAALAWRISEENFMKNQTFMNNLKLRGRIWYYGQHGYRPV